MNEQLGSIKDDIHIRNTYRKTEFFKSWLYKCHILMKYLLQCPMSFLHISFNLKEKNQKQFPDFPNKKLKAGNIVIKYTVLKKWAITCIANDLPNVDQLR